MAEPGAGGEDLGEMCNWSDDLGSHLSPAEHDEAVILMKGRGFALLSSVFLESMARTDLAYFTAGGKHMVLFSGIKRSERS